MSNAKLRDRLHGARTRPPRVVVPADWPAALKCPDCGRSFATERYTFLTRVASAAEMLNPVLVCPGCTHVFSPAPAWLEAGTA